MVEVKPKPTSRISARTMTWDKWVLSAASKQLLLDLIAGRDTGIQWHEVKLVRRVELVVERFVVKREVWFDDVGKEHVSQEESRALNGATKSYVLPRGTVVQSHGPADSDVLAYVVGYVLDDREGQLTVKRSGPVVHKRYRQQF